MAVAFPRFHDIYQEAKVHESWGRIEDDAGRTFEATLGRALRSGLPLVQIATWNDWGEGTIIEPSVEFGYRDLEVMQRLRRRHVEPAFGATPDDLRLPLRLYTLRKAAAGRIPINREIDRIARLIADRSCRPAREALERLERESRQRTGGSGPNNAAAEENSVMRPFTATTPKDGSRARNQSGSR